MDSKEINKQIKKEIRPLLKQHGFERFTARSSWRYFPDRIEVVNFQSFNWYNAEILHVTTFSFAVNLGIYFLYVPEKFLASSIKNKDNKLLPEEYSCHFRRRLFKTIEQPECNLPDTWYIGPNGEYQDLALQDVKKVILSEAFAWFNRFSDKTEVLRTLLEDDENNGERGWGFGAKGSPNRNYQTGYVALSLSNYELAIKALNNSLESGCYNHARERLEQDIQEAVRKS
jgi:hypothetical protein